MKRVFPEARAVELAAFAIDHQTDYLRIMKESLKNGDLRIMEGYGDIGLECGYYSPTIADAFTHVFSRGKIYCKNTRKKMPDYLFYFDSDNQLVMWRGMFEIPACFGVYKNIGEYRYGVRYQQIQGDELNPQLVTRAMYSDGLLRENISVWGKYRRIRCGHTVDLKIPEFLHVLAVLYSYNGDNVVAYKEERYVLNTNNMEVQNIQKEERTVSAEVSGQYIQFLRQELGKAKGTFEKGAIQPDDQRSQLTYLEKNYRQEMNLEGLCQLFDKMLSFAERTTPDSLVGFIFEVTRNHFKLIRQTPGIEDEFYQLSMDVCFDILPDFEMCDFVMFENRSEMMKYIMSSEAYKFFSSIPVLSVNFSVELT